VSLDIPQARIQYFEVHDSISHKSKWMIWFSSSFGTNFLICVTVGPLSTHSFWSHAWSDYEEDKCVPAGKIIIISYHPIPRWKYICFRQIIILIMHISLFFFFLSLYRMEMIRFWWKMEDFMLQLILVFLPTNASSINLYMVEELM
jgi:hypothetical protein